MRFMPCSSRTMFYYLDREDRPLRRLHWSINVKSETFDMCYHTYPTEKPLYKKRECYIREYRPTRRFRWTINVTSQTFDMCYHTYLPEERDQNIKSVTCIWQTHLILSFTFGDENPSKNKLLLILDNY